MSRLGAEMRKQTTSPLLSEKTGGEKKKNMNSDDHYRAYVVCLYFFSYFYSAFLDKRASGNLNANCRFVHVYTHTRARARINYSRNLD